MDFQRHLFISYAHIDNVPLSDSQQGWITRFQETLSTMLGMRIGRKAEIWRDAKLRGNDIFADEIVQQFPKTELFIAILTPRYVESEWCALEVREFCKCAEATGGLVVGNKSRVLKVIKMPVENEEALPSVLRQALGYPFYVLDEQQVPLELDPAYGNEFTSKYNLKLARLAYDIAAFIRKIEDPAAKGPPKAPAAGPGVKPAIYLAECSFDRRAAREALESELRLHGYPVLPDIQLPKLEEDYIAAVESCLTQCQFSIHLVGSKYGVVPDGPSEKSVTILQNELAIARYKLGGGLRRIISLPHGTRSDSSLQQAFIESLLKNAELQTGADLLTGDTESLKGAVHAELKKLETPESPPAKRLGSKLIYLICDERDRQATIPVRKFLKSHGYDVEIPLFEGDAATVRRNDRDLLAECDAVILFYGSGNEAWKRAIGNELKKSGAYRAAPLLATYIYLAEPITQSKTELIDLEEPHLMNGIRGFSEAQMLDFHRTLESGGTAG